jgi:glycosyltransferase involved in cell wall biosynthesis
MQNIDELFDKPHMSCVRDSAKILKIPEWEGFTEINAGVMVIVPDKLVFSQMMKMIDKHALLPLNNTIRDIYSDQSVIDEYYHSWINLPHLHLPIYYNAFIAYLDRYKDFDESELKILHFAGGANLKFFLPNYNPKFLENLSDSMYKYAIAYMTNMQTIKEKLIPTKLSIIVPHYMESREVIKPLFDSLNNQKGIDFREFEVIFCDDGGDYITDQFLNQYENLKIKRVRSHINTGVAMNRQRGLDASKGKYVMFIDCDDCLFSYITLNRVFQVLKDYPDYEIYKGRYLSERIIEGTGQTEYAPCEDITHFHGKIYNKSFFEKWGIRFSDLCKVNEDTYFNGICFALQPKTVNINEPLVIWTYNKDSLSRRNQQEITFTGHIDYIVAREITLDFLLDKIPNNHWMSLLAQFIAIFYFDSQGRNWNNCFISRPELIDEIDEHLYQFYKKYEQFIVKIKQEEFIANYNKVRVNNYTSPDYIERELYYDYWDRIIEKHNRREAENDK